jgi:hypothetical protein
VQSLPSPLKKNRCKGERAFEVYTPKTIKLLVPLKDFLGHRIDGAGKPLALALHALPALHVGDVAQGH